MTREYRLSGPATRDQILAMCRQAQADHEAAERYRLTMLDTAETEIDRQLAELRQAHAANLGKLIPRLSALYAEHGWKS